MMADGWIPMPSPSAASRLLQTPGIETIDDLVARISIATEMSAEAARERPLQIWFTPWGLSGFGSGAWEASRLRDDLAQLAAIGVAGVTITLPGATVAEFERSLDTFAADVVDHLG